MHNWKWGRWHAMKYWVTCIFWAAAIVFTAAAWISVFKNDLFWGYGAQWWIWNSLMFGVLALYGRGGCGCDDCTVDHDHK